MSLIEELNEELNYNTCDDITCYSEIVSKKLNEGVSDYIFPLLAGIGAIGLVGGIIWLSYKMDKTRREKIQQIILSHITSEEYLTMKRIIYSDNILRINIEELKKIQKREDKLNDVLLKDSTLNSLKDIAVGMYSGNKKAYYVEKIERRIREILPDDLYKKYSALDYELYQTFNMHLFY